MTAARRLTLTAAELAVLAAGMTLPPGMIAAEPGEGDRQAAAARLRSAGLDANEAVAANLAVLTSPSVVVRIEAAVPGRVLVAWFTVAGPLGASLFALAGDTFEFSLFAAADLGREILRAVPDPADLPEEGVRSLLNPASAGEPPVGTVTLEALAAPDPGWFPWLPPVPDDVVTKARAATRGTLSALVTGRAPAGEVLAGQVMWLLTGDRWTGLRPLPQTKVRLEPVERHDFPAWLAPQIATILEASDAA